jgi:hypothetical protein
VASQPPDGQRHVLAPIQEQACTQQVDEQHPAQKPKQQLGETSYARARERLSGSVHSEGASEARACAFKRMREGRAPRKSAR